jgi:hypothetical protein
MTPELPGSLRAIAIGSAIGCVVALLGVAGILLLSGHEATVAWGVGGMAAFWGGLGFGSMYGGTLHLIRHSEEPQAQRAVTRAPQPGLEGAPGEPRLGGSARGVDDAAA